MAWTDVFEGSTVNAGSVDLQAYALAEDTTLSWALETSGSNVLAETIKVSSADPRLITLPDARQGPLGPISMIYNTGGAAITLKAADGTEVGQVKPGEAQALILEDNSTAGGHWRLFLIGAFVAGAQAGQLASESIVAKGGTLVQAMAVRNVTLDSVIGISDRARLLNWISGVGQLTFDAAEELGQGWFCCLRNSGDGALTVNVRNGTLDSIDGSTALILNPTESCIVGCDGEAFFTLSRISLAANNFTFTSINVAGNGTYTLSSGEQGFSAYRFAGVLTGTRKIEFPPTQGQFVVQNGTTGTFTFLVGTGAQLANGSSVAPISLGSGESKLLYCDGTYVNDAATAGISIPILVSQGGTGSTNASGALSNLGGSSVGIGVFTATNQAAGRSALGAGPAGDAIYRSESQVPLPVGSAPAPGLYMGLDSNSGWYGPSDGEWRFSVNGTDKAVLNSTGISTPAALSSGGDTWVNSGVLRLNQQGNRYLQWDGTFYSFNGADLKINGNLAYHAGNLNTAAFAPVGGVSGNWVVGSATYTVLGDIVASGWGGSLSSFLTGQFASKIGAFGNGAGQIVRDNIAGNVLNIVNQSGAANAVGLAVGTVRASNADPILALWRQSDGVFPSTGASATRTHHAGQDGTFYARSTINASSGSADYAECFEWADGNSTSEDRRGRTVVLVGDQIRPATAQDDPALIIGVVSVAPVVLGDAAPFEWQGRFLKDAYGQEILQDVPMSGWLRPDGKTAMYKPTASLTQQDDTEFQADLKRYTTIDKVPLPNPDYDPSLAYVSRLDRPEWAAIGLVGKLAVRDGEPLGERWILMKDLGNGLKQYLVR
jgi:hypothetical protein